MLPSERTLQWLRKLGYTASVVERWNPYAKIRQDLFGGIDILALHPDLRGVLGVQATTKANISSRVKKLHDIPAIRLWMQSGNELWVVGWAKERKTGTRQLWTPTIRVLVGG